MTPNKASADADSSRRKFVVGSFAGKKRPWTSDPSSIKRRSVFMFAVAIAVVAVPGGTLRKLYAQHVVDHFDGIRHSRIIGARSPKRTSASASGLMTLARPRS